ncbi:MAG: hypothetical protein JWO87_2855, partial [Phycisphaerales bacterium]|nr:hypothetical protein [Phycisphaerales bacterium]
MTPRAITSRPWRELRRRFLLSSALLITIAWVVPAHAAEQPPKPQDTAPVVEQANRWRAEHRLIDLHEHIDF